MAHAVLSRKTSTSLGVIESAISISAVHSICPMTLCTRSNMPLAHGFLTVVGLCLIPYDLHRYSKCSLSSLPLFCISKSTPWISTQPGFVYQISCTLQSLVKKFVSYQLLAVDCLLMQSFDYEQFHNLKPARSRVDLGQSHKIYLQIIAAFKSICTNEVNT
jgi:hypothetical protein